MPIDDFQCRNRVLARLVQLVRFVRFDVWTNESDLVPLIAIMRAFVHRQDFFMNYEVCLDHIFKTSLTNYVPRNMLQL